MKCCPALRLIQGKHYSRLVNARRQPRALSSYVRDSDPGLIYVRQTTSFLVGVRVCVNGHLRLAQKCSDDVRVSLRKTICSRGGRFPNRSRGGRFVRRSRVPNNSPSPGAPCQAPDEEIAVSHSHHFSPLLESLSRPRWVALGMPPRVLCDARRTTVTATPMRRCAEGDPGTPGARPTVSGNWKLWISMRALRREAEFLILFDSVFPANRFAG